MTAPIAPYVPGERLQVVLTVDVLSAPEDSIGDYDLGLADGRSLRMPLDHPGLPIPVVRLEPVGGAPTAGQIWIDRTGVEWWASKAADRYSNVEIILRTGDGRSLPWHKVHASPHLGPITLLRDSSTSPVTSPPGAGVCTDDADVPF